MNPGGARLALADPPSRPLPFFTISERTCDQDFQSRIPVLESRTPFFRNSLRQILNEGVHAPHDLYTGSAIGANLIKGQAN